MPDVAASTQFRKSVQLCGQNGKDCAGLRSQTPVAIRNLESRMTSCSNSMSHHGSATVSSLAVAGASGWLTFDAEYTILKRRLCRWYRITAFQALPDPKGETWLGLCRKT